MKIEYLFIGLILIIIGILFIFLSTITSNNYNNYDNYNNYNDNNIENNNGNNSNNISNNNNKYKPIENKNSVEFSGIIMIGPIPIVIGNSSPLIIVMSILLSIFMIIWIFLYYINIKGLK